MEKLESKIDSLIAQVERMEKIIDDLSPTCKRMEDHINFIERVYTILRSPLDFITRSVERITGDVPSDGLPTWVLVKSLEENPVNQERYHCRR
jgi:hypothetical protein